MVQSRNQIRPLNFQAVVLIGNAENMKIRISLQVKEELFVYQNTYLVKKKLKYK